jgi:CO/xanthine dehydrogenase FAD-binding subunit
VKPVAFEYFDPRTLAEALDLLARYGEEAKLLAGGQSLVPLMNFRLARPKVLIDLNPVTELAYIREADGGLRIGAMTRDRTLESSPLVRAGCPLLAEASSLVGHLQIRNRSTIGGAVCQADPAGELPAALLALDATFKVRGPGGERTSRPGDFFLTYLTTSLEPPEMLTEISVPQPPPRTGHAFLELSRRHGDFALVGVAALLTLNATGKISRASLALAGAGPTCLRARVAEGLLLGERPGESLFERAGEQAAKEAEPDDDVHASAEYRRELVSVLTKRALQKAYSRLPEGP